MSKEERISIRAYAALCRTTHQTVSAAIKSGLIVDGYDRKEMKIIKSVADLEWGVDFMKKRAPVKAEQSGFDYSAQYFNSDKGSDESETPVDFDEKTRMDELMRLDLYYKVKQSKLKLEKDQAMLVNKQMVYSQLYEFGRNLRTKIKALPDTIIDRLITLDRDAAKLFLDEELHKILETFSNDVRNFNSGDIGRPEAGAEDDGF